MSYQLKRFIEGVVRAMLWNQDALFGWENWSPTVTQGVSVAVTVDFCRYRRIGYSCRVAARLVVTGAGTNASAIVIGGQPAAATPRFEGNACQIGTAFVLDSGTINYVGALSAQDFVGWQIMLDQAGNWLGANPAFALANNDIITFEAEYEVTSAK